VSNGSKRNAGTATGGVARRRRGASPQPQRPFVVAAKPTAAGATTPDGLPAARLTVDAGEKPASASAPKLPANVVPTAMPKTMPAPAPEDTESQVVGSVDGSLLRVTRYALACYLRNPWFAVDAVLVLALFFVCYRSNFDTINFFSSANFLAGLLSAIGAYGLVHGVVPPERYLPLARVNGAARTVGGLTLAAVIIRAAYCLVFVGLALAFRRFYGLDTGLLLAGWLGLIVACTYLAALAVCLSSPIAPRAPRIVALVLVALGFASFNATDLLGDILLVARIPLFPFVAPYRLGIAPGDLLAWLGTVLLTPAAIVGLILLAAYWLRRAPALASAETAADAPAQPVAVAR
jgi:hypothetical protein